MLAWGLKSPNKSFRIKWSVIKQVPAVCPGMKVCSLCTEEKRMIMLSDKNNTLNIRSELSSLYVCMAIKHIIVLFVETPRKFITAVINLRGVSTNKTIKI